MDGNCLDAQLAARAQDSQRDLATVGDDDLLQHGHALFDYEQGLTEFNWVAVWGHKVGDAPGFVGLDLVHHFHGFDDAHNLLNLNPFTEPDEGFPNWRP